MNDDSPDISDLSFEQKIALLEEELPRPILDFLHSPARDATSLGLSRKYRLHADQAAAFERAYLYMLIGVNSPHDFVQDLKDAGIDLESIKGLTNDINEQVFKKLLREEFQDADKPRKEPERQPAPAQVPVMTVSASSLPPVASSQPAPSFNLAPREASKPEPMFRTMQSDMAALQQGSVPSLYPAPPSLHPTQATPARMFQTASVPVAAPSVRPAPEMLRVVPDVPPSPVALPSATPPVRAAQVAAADSYSSDPYRESI